MVFPGFTGDVVIDINPADNWSYGHGDVISNVKDSGPLGLHSTYVNNNLRFHIDPDDGLSSIENLESGSAEFFSSTVVGNTSFPTLITLTKAAPDATGAYRGLTWYVTGTDSNQIFTLQFNVQNDELSIENAKWQILVPTLSRWKSPYEDPNTGSINSIGAPVPDSGQRHISVASHLGSDGGTFSNDCAQEFRPLELGDHADFPLAYWAFFSNSPAAVPVYVYRFLLLDKQDAPFNGADLSNLRKWALDTYGADVGACVGGAIPFLRFIQRESRLRIPGVGGEPASAQDGIRIPHGGNTYH